MLVQLFVILAALAVASAQQWAIVSGTSATTLVGVGATGNTAVAAAADNGSGAYVGYYAGSTWEHEPLSAGLLLDAGITATGTRVVASILPIYVSNDGVTFTRAPVSGTSQSVNTFGSNGQSIAVTGAFTSKAGAVNGVATTTDNGATWSMSANVPPGYARYGAFPSESTWYVSSGIWGNDPTSNTTSTSQLSSRYHVQDGKIVHKPSFNLKEFQQHRKEAGMKAGGPGATGWFGAVSKTTDGGKTWTQVLTTNLGTDYVYFNGISCGSETNCVVVGEGETTSGPYVVAYTTFDGGNTWSQTLKTNDLGLMSAVFTSETDVWLAGITQSGRSPAGNFWKSTDGGKTFASAQVLAGCLPIDMAFANGVGYAACSTSSGVSCMVAMYQ